MNNVFVSSTFSDLQSHRAAVRDGVRQLGLIDVSMENLGARDQRPKDECLRLIREQSELFVGIYAHRYGFVPEGDAVSITESEYETATLADLPRFIYIIDPEHPWRPAHMDDGEAKVQLESLKNRLLARHICQRFTSEDQLTASVVADLGRHIAMREATRVGPGIDVPDIGIESMRGSVSETPDEWNAIRNKVYDDSRGIFIAHVIQPSRRPDQDYDVFIYLLRHKSDDLTDVRFAEFCLGNDCDDRLFTAILHNGFIG
ncbi:MAG: DUF4062 domain-containing protein, partial [bacterium]|nr:DUF4062 domain-containing protein [bacterium]